MLSGDKFYDRLTGEELPGPGAFVHTELAAFTPAGFRRNVLAHSPQEIAHWRMRYDNTGLFRSVLYSNEPDFLAKYREESTLFYGDLCFDCDVDKDAPEEKWLNMIDEIATKLIPALKADFDLPDEVIRVWFSGSRGLHIEVPAKAIGVWPHHQLHRIFGYYAKDLKERDGLEYVDLSLYGGKHLYRLENSVHQRSGLYKWPLKVSELPLIKNFAFLTKVAATVRPGKVWDEATDSTDKGRARFTQLAQVALEVKPRSTSNQVTPGDISQYRRERFHCIDTLYGEGYLMGEGNRNTTAFLLASHLRQNGFNYEQAEKELYVWASEHCDPPFTSEQDTMEWKRALTRVYESVDAPAAGCTFIQQTLPHLCEESVCPIGVARRSRQSRVQVKS